MWVCACVAALFIQSEQTSGSISQQFAVGLSGGDAGMTKGFYFAKHTEGTEVLTRLLNHDSHVRK